MGVDQYVVIYDHEGCSIRPVESLHEILTNLTNHEDLAVERFSTERCLFGDY